VRTLERQWRAWLATRTVSDAHRDHVFARLGRPRNLPESLRSAKGVDLLAARTLDQFAAEDAAKWTFADGALRGAHDGPWTHVHSRESFPAKVAVRVRLRFSSGDAVKLRCNRADGHTNEVIFASWATYLTSGGGFASNEECKLAKGVWHDVYLVHDGGACRVYLDGALVLEAGDAPSQVAGQVGFAVEKGSVEVASFEVLKLP
jgi:hypothetical protein